VRQAIDVRPARLRYLLSHEHEGRHEVCHPAERRRLHGTEGRDGVQHGPGELLRRLHRDGLRIDQHDDEHDHAGPPVRVRLPRDAVSAR